MSQALYLAPAAGILALLFALWKSSWVNRQDPGNEEMQTIADHIRKGAMAFLGREYRVLAIFVAVAALLLAFFSRGPDTHPLVAVSFVCGAFASGLAGFFGMRVATAANVRTAQAARRGIGSALGVAFSGGSVMGLSVAGLGILGLSILFIIYSRTGVDWTMDRVLAVLSGFSLGASSIALFARVGGGIYTKAADVGADLVGKVEAGIPEDDPRNPAVIADNVGDNVGDVAGLGADLLESYVESIIASLAIAAIITVAGGPTYVKAFPFIVAAIGIVASGIGVMYVKTFAKTNPQGALMMGTYISAGLTVIGVGVYVGLQGSPFTLQGVEYSKWGPFIACILGIVSGSIIGFVSEFFTSGKYSPVRNLAERCKTGPAIAVTEGTAIGMQSTALPVVVLAASVVLAYYCCGVYGIAIAALGMLATTGMVVAVDAYGPIADNAGGIAEMAGLDPKVRKITDNLDAVGNTTAAIGKGFAIGSAAFAAIGLLSAFMLAVQTAMGAELGLSLANPMILAGLLIGAMMPFLFSSMLFRAVGKCADTMILEVRRQFREIPGLKEGKEGVKPDSTRCVDIATQGAIRGMMLPGGLAIVFPVIIGGLLGPAGLAGMLVGAIATGVMLGIQTANSGGAMDNAKKYIEEGHHGGKGSDAHKAAVVGDTVGDPLKDTVGPSINILIKLMCVISLVLAPLSAKFPGLLSSLMSKM